MYDKWNSIHDQTALCRLRAENAENAPARDNGKRTPGRDARTRVESGGLLIAGPTKTDGGSRGAAERAAFRSRRAAEMEARGLMGAADIGA